MSHASLSECMWTCIGANESCGMRSNYRLVRRDDPMAGILFMRQRESDIWKNVGSTEIIMNRLCHDEIAMKAGLSSFEELRLDT